MVRPNLAVLILSTDFLLLEELVQSGLGVIQGPVPVEVGVEVHFLRLQSLESQTERLQNRAQTEEAQTEESLERRPTACASCSSLLE